MKGCERVATFNLAEVMRGPHTDSVITHVDPGVAFYLQQPDDRRGGVFRSSKNTAHNTEKQEKTPKTASVGRKIVDIFTSRAAKRAGIVSLMVSTPLFLGGCQSFSQGWKNANTDPNPNGTDTYQPQTKQCPNPAYFEMHISGAPPYVDC